MSALPFLHCQLQSAFCSSVYVDRVLKQMSEVNEYMTIVRFFVMSICISSHYLRVKDRGKELRGPSNDDCSAFIERNFCDDSHIVMNAVQKLIEFVGDTRYNHVTDRLSIPSIPLWLPVVTGRGLASLRQSDRATPRMPCVSFKPLSLLGLREMEKSFNFPFGSKVGYLPSQLAVVFQSSFSDLQRLTLGSRIRQPYPNQ